MRSIGRSMAKVAILVSIAGLFQSVSARDLSQRADEALEMDEQVRLLRQIPSARIGFNRAPSDTSWFGGYDEATGTAILGGVWDFEDGTTQGWFSTDLTEIPIRFRHVTIDSCQDHGDLICPVINYRGSMWVGWHEDEATALCWPGGQGYGNSEGQYASKMFTYAGTGSITLSFDYFVDSETSWDFTYVYVVTDQGIWNGPFNTCTWPTASGGGYSGSNQDGYGIGSPESPAHDTIIVDSPFLPDDVGPFEIFFKFDSDPLVSDALDGHILYLDSWYGPFGFDDFRVLGVGLDDFSDFEPTGVPGEEYDGWLTAVDPPIGTFMQVAHLSELDEIAVSCPCPLTQGDNQYVMVAADISPINFPHPKRQSERMQSPPAYVGGGGVGTPGLISWSVYQNHIGDTGVGYQPSLHYYPWTCPETGVVGWTVQPAHPRGDFYIFYPLGCVQYMGDASIFMPTEVDSVRAVLTLMGDCDDFGVPPDECIGPAQTNQSPYWDDIQVGATGAGGSPVLLPWSVYRDCYSEANTLLPDATARMLSSEGDSIVIRASLLPDVEAYMHFRARPGPMANVGDPFFISACGGDPLAPSWATVRMDTAETAQGVQEGYFASYYHEDDPCFTPPDGGAHNKVLPDDVFTPGTTIEYFFTANFTDSIQATMWPDTARYGALEVQVLPGYFWSDGDIRAPCLLYDERSGRSTRTAIEDYGLRPYLGTVADDAGREHDAWDRFDPGPLARSPLRDGLTRFQSMIYRTILYGAGSYGQGISESDADLFINFLTNDDFGRHDFQKGLWLNGNQVALDLQDGGPSQLQLLVNYCGAQVGHLGQSYRDFTGDSSACVRLDPAAARDFPPPSDSYSAVRGNGCPRLVDYRLLDLTGDASRGNQVYVDQDAGGGVTTYASVSNDQFTPINVANYRVVLDAYSLHHLRATPDGWTGADCGSDTSAITRRVGDVFSWLGVPGSGFTCEPIIVDVEDGVASAPPIRTRLFQNTPNPFNPTTIIRYQLAEKAHVRLLVFDVAGRQVRTLVEQLQVPGRYEVSWDATTDGGARTASGVYWVRMSTSLGFKASTKMVVLK